MSDNLERILITNMPIFVDEWLLKSTTPCGDLIHRVEKHPLDSSKVVILAKGQESAKMIARTLDNYNLFGSVIQAWFGFTNPQEASKALTNSNTVHEIQGEMEKKSHEKTHGGHSSKQANTKPAKAEDQTGGKLHQQRQRRSSATVGPTEVLDDAQRVRSVSVGSSKTSSREAPRRKASRSGVSLRGSEQAKDASSRKSRRCRFCHRPGHATWLCKKRAEYYKVGWTKKGTKPTGYQWPESCIVKVEELSAGPIIEYIEKSYLKMEKMNREEIRIMFAWLTNFCICYDCGAAGHQETDRLCKYLPLDQPLTEEEIAQFRKPFCRQMKSIRDKVPLGELQLSVRTANQQFRRRMDTHDEKHMKSSEKRDKERTEKPQEDASAERTHINEEHNQPEESGTILFAPDGKRVKVEQPQGYDQVSDDDDDDVYDVVFLRTVAPRKRPGHPDPSGTVQEASTSTRGTLEEEGKPTCVHIE